MKVCCQDVVSAAGARGWRSAPAACACGRRLWLHFADDDTVELDMEGSPKPAVFILHNLLSARVHSLPGETATQPL
ncbi:Uncharacterized protein OBRU01_16596 [Operophtera brumata]|uniref:Syntrophin C-terminal PH domain-containing protein n=1 Tax=Operophtera brumata TaxID=104452 RepID=A0A0L7L2T1_OPEBR|nr:Uncharacterized protein OBRU01_16596 [Operophtera brumata]